jgi:hypothetical protein
LLGRPEGEGPLRRATRRWEDIIKIDINCIGCRFIKLIWRRIEKAAGWCEQSSLFSVVCNAGDVLTVCGTVGLSTTTVLSEV